MDQHFLLLSTAKSIRVDVSGLRVAILTGCCPVSTPAASLSISGTPSVYRLARHFIFLARSRPVRSKYDNLRRLRHHQNSRRRCKKTARVRSN
jgi:hypothetical protein